MGATKHGVLANLGMARKLGLGFALVLLLTLAVAAIGIAALHSVGQRFDGLRQLAHRLPSYVGSALLSLRRRFDRIGSDDLKNHAIGTKRPDSFLNRTCFNCLACFNATGECRARPANFSCPDPTPARSCGHTPPHTHRACQKAKGQFVTQKAFDRSRS